MQQQKFLIEGVAAIQSISPNNGSIFGGTVLTIYGNGFDRKENTKVSIGNSICDIQSVTSSNIVCVTPNLGKEGNQIISIISNNINFSPSKSLAYTLFSTPSVTKITPTSGVFGKLITINGFGFGNSKSNNKNLKFLKLRVYFC